MINGFNNNIPLEELKESCSAGLDWIKAKQGIGQMFEFMDKRLIELNEKIDKTNSNLVDYDWAVKTIKSLNNEVITQRDEIYKLKGELLVNKTKLAGIVLVVSAFISSGISYFFKK
jgi:hypothetical protein